MKKFNPKDFEIKWQEKWKKDRIYQTPNDLSKEKFYSLYSYPYPSGAGLHVGHVEGMVANDIVARYERMRGKNVLFPMGWDSFGLPAENYAIKTGTPPKESTDTAVATFKNQIDTVGISVDWDTEVGAHWPEYYKWTQWIFVQLYKAGKAYQKEAPVNWDPVDQTVLANEQVLPDGTAERSGAVVIQKNLKQWFFKITDYAEQLHKDLDKIDWPESTKQQQRNWIGRSEGAEVIWELDNPETKEEFKIHTFTTRFDTIPGPTFLVVAPEYPEMDKLVIEEKQVSVTQYIEKTTNKTLLDRQKQKVKTGVFTGSYAINPFNSEKVPIYVADYVLVNYGTGAVMGMPGHDQRDFEFAKTFDLPVKHTLKPKDGELPEDRAYEGDGYQINSGEFDGLWWKEAREKIIEKLKSEKKAIKRINYRLRDWLVSRQRYWGCPIPIVYDPEGNPHPVKEEHLPILLPTDVDFKPTGESPIKGSKEFKNRAEELYGEGWYFESDTLDTFIDSSWYFFRHTDAKNKAEWASTKKLNYWLPTDLYMIGTEHIVLHLLYSRFFTKFFFDKEMINFDEPFYKMRHMGIIQGPDGRKMSKRWGNVINPTDEVAKYGADTLRIYEMFMGPLEESKPWNDRAESGVFRFLTKVWMQQEKVVSSPVNSSMNQQKLVNKLIKKAGEDIDALSFNTTIAKMMEFINALHKETEIEQDVWEKFLKVLAPFAPFITEELWETLGYKTSIHLENWPKFDESLIQDDIVTLGVQINGKMRGTIDIAPDADQKIALKLAHDVVNVKNHLAQKEVKKVIYIPGKILNIIV